MNPIDVLIIYLSCGAPFGVYYYYQKDDPRVAAFLKSVSVITLWIPYALALLFKHVTNRVKAENVTTSPVLGSDVAQELEDAKKHIEGYLCAAHTSQSLFEFREMMERYAGLTIANHDTGNKNPDGLEVFRIANAGNPELGTICLNRHNRKRLKFHQSEARKEFLSFLDRMFCQTEYAKTLGRYAHKFVKLLDDTEAIDSVETLIRNTSNDKAAKFVNVPEKELWNLEKQLTLTDEPSSQNLRVLTATASSPKKG